MIELPEAMTLSKQLGDAFTGKTAARVIAAQSPHGFAFYSGDPITYAPMLEGKTVTGAKAYGGRVELWFEDMTLCLGDGVNARFLADEQDAPKKHQLLIIFTDKTALCCTIAMYGGLWLYPKDTDQGFYDTVARERPSPLSDAFDADYFQSLVSGNAPKLSAKAFLATEQRVPGLGNGVLQDILFTSRIHPKSKMAALDADDIRAMYGAVKTLLLDMTQLGGRDTEKDLFAKPGGYVTIMSRKNEGMPCPRCGAPIQRMAYLGGNVYVCETCQPLKK